MSGQLTNADYYLDATCPTCHNTRGVTESGAPSWLNAGNCPTCAVYQYDGNFPLSFLGNNGRVRCGKVKGECEVAPGPDGGWLTVPIGDFITRHPEGYFTVGGSPNDG